MEEEKWFGVFLIILCTLMLGLGEYIYKYKHPVSPVYDVQADDGACLSKCEQVLAGTSLEANMSDCLRETCKYPMIETKGTFGTCK